jgi:quinohemoprotein ethanol dehydrogenase
LNAGWKYGAQPRRLLAFRLDGEEMLAPSAPPDFTVAALDDPGYAIDKSVLGEGRILFTFNCAICHGVEVASTGFPAPDLRESGMALSRDSLWQVVHDGVLVKRGMPRFETLTEEQVDKIYNFIRFQAREALRNPASATPGRKTSGR